MALLTETLTRKFVFFNKNQQIELNDIPGLSPEDVKDVYAGNYPELTNGTVEYKGIIDDFEVYHMKTVIGTKG